MQICKFMQFSLLNRNPCSFYGTSACYPHQVGPLWQATKVKVARTGHPIAKRLDGMTQHVEDLHTDQGFAGDVNLQVIASE